MKKIALIPFFILIFPFMGLCEIKEEVLKNGLKVIVIEDSSSAVATFQVWYKVGGIDEPEGKSGISHLLEHLMFRGSKNYPGNVFSKIIQSHGGVDNAFTTKDYTMYFQKLAPSKLNISIDLESDRMANLLLNREDFETEKKIVLEERRQRYEDSPENLIFEEVISNAYKAHPYRRPVIGWAEDIQLITFEDIKQHYEKFYCPNNAFIIVAGDIKKEDIIAKVRDKFENIPPCKIHERKKLPKEPKQNGERRIILKRQTHLPLIVMAYKVPAFPNKESLSLEILSTILGEGKSSRLYRKLVTEKALSVDVSTSNSPLSRDGFLFFIATTVKDKKNIQEVEKIIREEIERIHSELIDSHEIEKAKNQVEASFLFSQDSVFGHSLILGKFEIIQNWKMIDIYKNSIMEISAKDIQTVTKKYLNSENLTVGVLIPK